MRLTNRTPISLEFFPPKTVEGADKLRLVRQNLYALKPEFCSVTFGAGGSTQEGTFNTVRDILGEGVPAASHFSCVGAIQLSIIKQQSVDISLTTLRSPDNACNTTQFECVPETQTDARVCCSLPSCYNTTTCPYLVPSLADNLMVCSNNTCDVTVHGWDYMAALLKNVRLTDSSETSFKWLKDGEVAAGFIFEKMLMDYTAAGAPLKMVVAEEGVIQQTDGCGLIAGAPHPGPAAAFLTWMASAEAHGIVRDRLGRRSLRKGIAASPGLIDLTGIRIIQPDVDWITNHRDEILQRFEAARPDRFGSSSLHMETGARASS